MAKFRCTVCNYIYDEEKEGKKFSELPPNWVCPVCSAPKSAFEEIGVGEKKVEKVEIITTVADKIIEQLAAAGVKLVFGIPNLQYGIECGQFQRAFGAVTSARAYRKNEPCIFIDTFRG